MPRYTFAQEAATTQLAATLGRLDLAADLGPVLTCTEADVFVAWLEVHGRLDAAAQLLDAHALADDVDDEHQVDEHGRGKHREPPALF